jgi:poly-gamma-glutamate system protein
MKKLYWRPPGVSRRALVLVALVATAALAVVRSFPVKRKQAHYGTKMKAARLASKGMAAIRKRKAELGLLPSRKVDPRATGMIGESITQVTSNTGFLSVKQFSTNPNFAAVIVHLLGRAGLKRGDTVAVGVSGSFPALNLAADAAAAAMGLRALIIASGSSSEWGANHEKYLWVDMHKTLREAGLSQSLIHAASYGGIDDLGIGLTNRGLTLIDEAFKRNGIERLEPKSLADSIRMRMARYDELSEDQPIKAYVNVGGGSASVGTHVGKKQFKPGLNREVPRAKRLADSVMLRFAKRGIPVIHVSRVKLIAERYGLPLDTSREHVIGDSSVFVNVEYDLRLVWAALATILGVMFAFIRWDVGIRMMQPKGPQEDTEAPEQMV